MLVDTSQCFRHKRQAGLTHVTGVITRSAEGYFHSKEPGNYVGVHAMNEVKLLVVVGLFIGVAVTVWVVRQIHKPSEVSEDWSW